MGRAYKVTPSEMQESLNRVRARLFAVQFENAADPDHPLNIYPPVVIAPEDYKAALLKTAGSTAPEKLLEADRALRFQMVNEFERGGMSEDRAAIAVVDRVLKKRPAPILAPPAKG